MYAVEMDSCWMIYVPRFMKIGTDLQAISRFYLSNLNGCNVGITEERVFLFTPLRWAQVPWYSYQVSSQTPSIWKILNGSDDAACHSGLLGFWTLSNVWNSKKHGVSETGSVSVLTSEGGRHTLLGPLETADPNHWTTVSETMWSLMFFRIPEDGQRPKTQQSREPSIWDTMFKTHSQQQLTLKFYCNDYVSGQQTERYISLEINLFFIPSWIQFWIITIALGYFNAKLNVPVIGQREKKNFTHI
jgi:hypothetical protein